MASKSIFFKYAALYFITVFFFVSFFIYSTEIRESIINSARNCAICVIPSLFPFMIISRIIIKSNLTSPFENTAGRILNKLYKLPTAAATPFLLGITCSFPVGAKSACELFETGKINKDETEKIMALSNNTGPAFLISAVGEAYWENKALGAIIYFIQIISAFLCGFLLCRNKKNKTKLIISNDTDLGNKPFLAVLSDSISTSALSALSVSGFIVFFSVIIKIITLSLNLNTPELLAVVSSILEFSSGALHSSALGGKLGASLTGFAIGFGGLSVICQSVSFCSKYKISIIKTVIFKLLQGVCCAGMIFGAVSLFPSLISNKPYKSAFSIITPKSSYLISAIVFIIFLYRFFKINISKIKKRSVLNKK